MWREWRWRGWMWREWGLCCSTPLLRWWRSRQGRSSPTARPGCGTSHGSGSTPGTSSWTGVIISVFRIHIHWIRIRIRIQRTPESGSNLDPDPDPKHCIIYTGIGTYLSQNSQHFDRSGPVKKIRYGTGSGTQYIWDQHLMIQIRTSALQHPSIPEAWNSGNSTGQSTKWERSPIFEVHKRTLEH